jgi:hypothetical protein
MQIIILYIPPKTTLDELNRFAKSGVVSPFAFWRRCKITKCEILDVFDKKKGARVAHGVVSFASDEEAEKAIDNLNGKQLKGKPVEVRAYHNRSPSDKRIQQFSGGKQLFKDSRSKTQEISKRSEKGGTERARPVAKGLDPIEPSSRLQKALKPSEDDDYYWNKR